jgi:hypothetical protein
MGTSLLLPTFAEQLADPAIRTVLLDGCGGGFDFVHALALYPELIRLDKEVVIGSYSFGDPQVASPSGSTARMRRGPPQAWCRTCRGEMTRLALQRDENGLVPWEWSHAGVAYVMQCPKHDDRVELLWQLTHCHLFKRIAREPAQRKSHSCGAAVCASRSRCSRKNAHIWLVASTPLLVDPSSHSGSGLPPGQEWPPPWTRYSTTAASPAQFVYSIRVTSAATTASTGLVAQRFLRAQFAAHVGTSGNDSGDTHEAPPWYGTTGSAVP